MEAEEPHTTMDAEKHPSSKDPSAEDSQEPLIPDTPLESSISHIALEPHTAASQTMPSTSHTELETYISENPLEPSVSETPLEPPTSESQMMSPTSHTELETYIPENPLEPSIPETPLELNTSESQMMPPTSQTPLETYTSETLLEPSISKASLEHSKVPEDLTLYNSSPDHVSDALKTGLSSEISWPGSSTQIRESEILPEYSLLDPSAKVHLDTFAEERKEEGEDKEGEDATVSTTHTAQPGRHLGKKKKKGVSRDTASPVVLAKQAELVEVPEAMQREKCGAHVNNPFQWEKNAALKATQTDISVPCNVSQCRCLMFCFIPSSPEEAVAATALSQISSVQPVTGVGRNTRLSLRLRRPGDEEGGLAEQTMCLLQRFLPSEKPSSATLTSRSYRSRGPLAIPALILVPLGSLTHPVSDLALQLTPVPDPFTSALPSSRDRHCQQLAQACVSLVQISNKGEATGL
ncbi:hypothetical protein D623_10017864 [Myotis brandtii]|uniref:Uncharacterized protein n=1 Tax=Myotis brandtii TaxID=109478 RepID=S7NMM6_MYOBR|nr:hypothetical protein D623_10017864 [Myotis brandtii]